MSNLPLQLAQSLIPNALHKMFGVLTSMVYGKARWMTGKEQKQFLSPDHSGLVFSQSVRLSLFDSCKIFFLVTPTGLGKTTQFVISIYSIFRAVPWLLIPVERFSA